MDTGYAARLACVDIYDPITEGIFDAVFRVNETVCGVKRTMESIYVVMQGTENAPGWEADFDAVPHYDPVLGMLHSGFYKNLPALIQVLTPRLTAPPLPVAVCGHSKGAAEGSILAAMLSMRGYRVSAALFACPNAGGEVLADYLAAHVPGESYRNRGSIFGDPVPLVPTSPYVPPYDRIVVCQPPPGLKRFVNLEWHRGPLYHQAFGT